MNVRTVLSKISIASWLLLISLSVYFILAAKNLNLPGIQYDEVLQNPSAIALIRNDVNGHYNKFGTQVVKGKAISLMTLEYIGAVKTYLLSFTLSLGGVNVKTLRITGIIICVFSLFITWLYARDSYDRASANIAVWLLATDPLVIMLTRTDWGPIVIAFLARILSLLLLLKWWKSKGRNIYLILTSGILGLGVYDKTNFLWFVMAIIVAGGAAWLLTHDRPRLTVKAFLLSVFSFFLVSFPLWLYNAYYDWPTFQILRRGQQNTTIAGLISTIESRTGTLIGMLNGGGPDLLYFGEAVPSVFGPARTLLFPLVAISMIGLILMAIIQRKWNLCWLPALTALIAVQIYLTPLSIGMHHWTMIYPFPHLAVGMFLGAIIKNSENADRNRSSLRWAVICAVIVAVGFNLKTVSSYYELLNKTGGVKHWSAEIYQLSAKLRAAYPDRPIELMDWGLGNTLFFLSEGQLFTNEPYWDWAYSNTSEPNENLLKMVRDPRNVFVLNAPEGTLFPNARKAFYRAIEQTGQRVIKEERLYDRRSIWVYSIIEVGR